MPGQGGPKAETGAGKPAGSCSDRTATRIFEAWGHLHMSKLVLRSPNEALRAALPLEAACSVATVPQSMGSFPLA